MREENLKDLTDKMIRLDVQLNDLLKWVDIVDIKDFNDKEILLLISAYRSAGIRINKINKLIYTVCKRMKDEGIDLFDRKEKNNIKKKILLT